MQLPILVIPAYNPDEELIKLIQNLKETYPKQPCIVVNDGSASASNPIFDRLQKEQVLVLKHEKNQGKGAALKTAIRHIIEHEPQTPGMITADADGQHTLTDIMAIREKMLHEPKALHLGVRTLTNKRIPLRSRIGNYVTRILFNRVTKNQIRDTQTGLRGIPMNLMHKMLESKSSRYEFEFEMFFVARRLKLPLIETPIQTIYINNNEKSHFNPFLDSLKIYYIFIRFCGVALLSFCVDFSLFCALYYQNGNMGQAMLEARIISATCNFFLNKNITFKTNHSYFIAACKFAVLALVIGIFSFKLLELICLTGLNIYLSKILAECLLFLASFFVQYSLIFIKRKIGPKPVALTA